MPGPSGKQQAAGSSKTLPLAPRSRQQNESRRRSLYVDQLAISAAAKPPNRLICARHSPPAPTMKNAPSRRYARYAWLSPCRMLTLRNRPPLPPSGLLYNAEDPCHLTMKAASRPDDHAACTGLWISVQRTSDIDSRCRCLKSCAPMTEVGCTGHQPRLAGTPRWRVSAASDPVKHVLACASVSEKFARNQESTQGLVLLTYSFACSFQRFTTAGGSSARSGRCACGTVPGKAGFHGFGPVVRRVSAVARRPAVRGRSGCPARGPHRRAAGRPGRGRAAVSRPSGRRR